MAWDRIVRSIFDRPRHRPRDLQHARARARQGHRALRALRRRHGAGHQEGRRGRHRGQEDALEDPRRHRGHPSAARRGHRGLRGHREDDPLLHREGHLPALVREAPHGHRRSHLHHRGGEARRARLRRAGRRPRGLPDPGVDGRGHRGEHPHPRARRAHDLRHRRRHHGDLRHLPRRHGRHQRHPRRRRRVRRGDHQARAQRPQPHHRGVDRREREDHHRQRLAGQEDREDGDQGHRRHHGPAAQARDGFRGGPRGAAGAHQHGASRRSRRPSARPRPSWPRTSSSAASS